MNVIEVTFEGEGKTIWTKRLWQYDRDQTILIKGLDVGDGDQVRVYYAFDAFNGPSQGVDGVKTEDGITAAIPDELLVHDDWRTNYIIMGFIVVVRPDSADTVANIVIPVGSWPKPIEETIPEP